MLTVDFDTIFLPAKELDADTASLFAGRRELLLAALKSLSKSEGCVALFGDRGVGKSSLGKIVIGVLSGLIALDTLGIEEASQLPKRKCIRKSWKPETVSLQHLLYQLFDPSSPDPYSFAKQFPAIAKRFRQTFKQISLKELTLEASSGTQELGPNQVMMHSIVSSIEDCFAADPKAYPNLVVLIDELETGSERKQLSGLGRLIKNSRFQFILIGIGQSIRDILDDHQSTERKFVGGQFLVEAMKKDEVRELFNKAAVKATEQGAKLRFTDEFCDLVYEDFLGYPAQIQAFGLDVALHFMQRLEAGIAVNVEGRDYVPLLQLRETSPNRDVRAINDLDAGIDASVAKWEVLKCIANVRTKENVDWISLDRLRRLVPAIYAARIQDNLKSLAKHEVLVAKDEAATTVKIAKPAILCEIRRRIRQKWDPKSRLNN
jgi:hypothetical protein